MTAGAKRQRDDAPRVEDDDDDDSERGFVRSRTKKKVKRGTQKKAAAARPASPLPPPPQRAPAQRAPAPRAAPQTQQVIVIDDDSVIEIGSDSGSASSEVVVDCIGSSGSE